MKLDKIPHLPPAAIVAVLELIQKYPQLTQFYPMVLCDSTRENDKRNATIRCIVPDELVKNMRGDVEKRDNYAIVRLGRKIETYEQTGLVLPSGAGSMVSRVG